MTYVLDSNAWIAYMRGKDALVVGRVNAHPPADLALSTIVFGELSYGAYHSVPGNVTQNLLKVERLQRTYPILPFGEACADEYGQILAYLSSIGEKIGPKDTQIAATARAHNLILVTHNTDEFNRVPGLKIEDWQIP